MSNRDVITIRRGRAVRLLHGLDTQIREGMDTVGRLERLAAQIEAALDQEGPVLVLGVDCDGDGLPDVGTDEKAAQEVIRGACDCRFAPAPARDLPSIPGEHSTRATGSAR